MARSESSLAALLLTQRLVEGDVAPLKAAEYWAVVARVGHLKELLGLSEGELSTDLGLDPELALRIAALLARATQVAFAIDAAEQSGVRPVTSVDDDYPYVLVERLGQSAPPLLYTVGDTALLAGGGLGVVGSRDVAAEGAEIAVAAAREAASRDLTVISGGAKGVDRLAMGAALDASGSAVGLLADSLTRAARDPDIRRAVTDGGLCLATPYKPSAGFSVATAMGRNKLIYGLSTATLVIAADHEKGGTWAGAVEGLRARYAPVLVWAGNGGGTGNRPLIDRGGIPVDAIEQLFPLPSLDGQAEQLHLDL